MTFFRRHLKILEFALRSLLRRKYKNLALIAVYAFTIAVLASVLFLTRALRLEADAVLAETPALVVQKMAAGRHDLIPISRAAQIRDIPGVSDVQPRFWGYYYDSLTRANYTVMSAPEGPSQVSMLSGRLPEADGECALGAGVAAARYAEPGGDLALVDAQGTGRMFSVVGVFSSESALLTNDLVLLTRDGVRAFFDFPEQLATDLAVSVANDNEVATVAAKIKGRFPDTRPITRSEILRTYDAVFHWRSGMMLTIFASALIAFAILAWDKATGISAEEKREIGVLKAVGWDTSDVLTLKFWEGAVVSLLSFLLGVIAAHVHVFWFGAAALAPVVKGWSVLFPSFRLTASMDPYQIFVIGFLTVVPYVASTVVPSWKAALTDPDSVLRS